MSNSILIIDDEEKVVLLMATHLKEEGFEVITAVSFQNALPKIKQLSPHLILLNSAVLETEGCGIIAQLRQQADTPILLFTGYGTAVNVIDALDRGVDAVIVQPFSLLELSARIRAILRRAGIAVSRNQPSQQEINAKDNHKLAKLVSVQNQPVWIPTFAEMAHKIASFFRVTFRSS